MKDLTAMLRFNSETGEYVLLWMARGDCTRMTSTDERDIYARMRHLTHEGYAITVDPGSLPNMSVNEYASPAGLEGEHSPRHRFDCCRCRFSWNCGLACGCNLKDLPGPPEEVKLNRLRAFLEDGDRFIKDRESLERYVDAIWEDR